MRRLLKLLVYTLLAVFIFLNLIAAIHAYKLTHFYDGDYPPPPHIETLTAGQKANLIFLGMDYYKLKITSRPAHPYDTISITTADNIILKGWYVPRPAAKGTVILFHGHGGNRSNVVREADAFYNMGYNVCLTDFRDHGESGGKVCTIGYREAADVKAVYDYVVARGEKNVLLWGISMGAAAITKAMADYPSLHPAKIILEMPYGSLSDAVKGRLRLMHLPQQPFASLLTFWGGAEQGFWAFSMQPAAYARNINVPVLLQWGKKDVRVTEGETNAVFSNLSSAQKQLAEYDNSGHESLLKNEPAKWLATVRQFLGR